VGFVAALAVILLIEAFIFINLKNRTLELEAKYGDKLVELVCMDERYQRAQGHIIDLQSELIASESRHQSEILDLKRETYWSNKAWAVTGFYSYVAAKGSAKDYDDIYNTIKLYDIEAQRLWRLVEIKKYARSARALSHQACGEAKVESDFNSNLICQNYARDANKLFKLKDGRLGKSVYGASGKEWRILNPTTNKWAPISWGDISLILKPTTKDYGRLQVNAVNLEWGYSKLYKLGLWNEKMDQWVLHDRTNFLIRMLINEDRTRRGWDVQNAGHWDARIVTLLNRVRGYEVVFNAEKGSI
jgi:hypothetical protein